jgi:hypothetical protein
MLKYLLIIGTVFSTYIVAVPWKSDGVKHIPTPPTPLKSRLRSSSAPYVSTDSFRAICDHICDETDAIFIPEQVQYGDTIYIIPYIVKEFFKIAHPKIKHPYILVTGYGDCPNPSAVLHYLKDDKILAWFGTNCDIESHVSSKFIPIPIGLANNYNKFGNTIIMATVQKNSKSIIKKYLLGLNFSINTNVQTRKKAYNPFKNKKYCKIFLTDNHIGYTNFQAYLTDMASCKFIISPHGNGLDCYRTWEALLVGTIPIVKKSTLDPLYVNLPVIIVNDWSDITEEFLEQKYKEVDFSKYNLEKCYFKYWETLIKDTQRQFRTLKPLGLM